MLTFIDMTTTQWERPAWSLSSSLSPYQPQRPEPAPLPSRVLDSMGAVVVEMDAEGRIQFMNRACTQLVGASLDAMIGEDVRMLFANPEEMHVLTRGFEALRSGRAGQIHLEMHWMRDDAPPRLLEGTCTARRSTPNADVESLVLVGIDVTERRDMERDMTALNTAERRAVSQSLHESLGMQLAATAMHVQNLKAAVEQGTPCTADDLDAIADAIREGVDKARELSHELLPVSLQQDRLTEALSDLAREADRHGPGRCTFIGGDDLPAVHNASVAMHLHRIAEEAVANAHAHAAPTHTGIRLHATSRALVLTIHNDGSVWHPTQHDHTPSDAGKGLSRMRYRAHLIGATFHVGHSQGMTTVTCRLPLRRISAA
ncbi:hypothetical protein CRI93_09940 [Longimonas halophila]|uniref:histidine kinase n=1 Tax=Longimonas halophila TaxID=1469170 RepID=A0A2H3NL68_9BACT|nr:PAS domain-containing protein [Longimonas halophila]PEN06589.1 hypothetical protein CRI93_09940 [Longimonas halophila]